MDNLFTCIEYSVLLGIDIEFKKDMYSFKIIARKENKEEFVCLPYNHLTENKIVKYTTLLIEKLNEITL